MMLGQDHCHVTVDGVNGLERRLVNPLDAVAGSLIRTLVGRTRRDRPRRALAGSLANRRLAGGLPLSNDGVAQNTMRRLLPANVEKILHVDGVFGDAAYDALFVQAWDEGFFAGHEPGAHRYTLGTQAEGGYQASTVGNASRGQPRDRRDGVDHGGQQYGQSRCSPHVTAGFDALGDHEVDTRGGGRSSLIDRP